MASSAKKKDRTSDDQAFSDQPCVTSPKDPVQRSFTHSPTSRSEDTSEDPTIRWAVNHRPPEIEWEGAKKRDSPYPFENTANDDFSLGYIGPDRKGTPQQHSGDPTFYFVLDLGKSYTIEKLEIVNAYSDPILYNVRDYQIGVSDYISDFEMKKGSFPKISTSEIQSIQVNKTGRYVRMNMMRYGASSVGLAYLNVVKVVENEEEMEDKCKDINDQVFSCMKLLDEFNSLTFEKDGICVLRQKSGFASGISGKGGYADVKLLCLVDMGSFTAFDGVKVPLRIVGEVQLILRGYQEVKNRMHLAYEADRGSFGPICDGGLKPSLDD